MKIIIIRSILALIIFSGAIYYLLNRLQADVPVARAVSGTAVDAVTGTIKVVPSAEIILKTEIKGRVSEVPAKLGKAFKKGEVLFVLEAADLEIQLAMKNIQLEAGKSRSRAGYTQELDIASLEDEILKIIEMREFGQSSTSDLKKRKRDLEKLEIWLEREKIDRAESLDLLQQQIKQLIAKIEMSRIRAPFDGLITEILVIPGDIIFPGNAVGRLISNDRVVHLTLSEEDFDNVRTGQEVTLRFASYPGRTFQGEVTFIAPTADPDKKNRLVFLKAEASPELLVTGLTGEAVLIKARREGATLVPRRSLIANQVYLVKDGRIEIRAVQPGFLGLNKAEILEGVEPGEWVVLEDQSFLRDGQKVKPEPLEN